jgi:transcriptional regulator with XRE-family HTH domain
MGHGGPRLGMSLRALLGPTLRKLRKRRGLTQAELGTPSGLSAKVVSDIERGQINVGIDTIEALARGLELEPEVLMALIKTSGEAVRERGAFGGYDSRSGRRTLGLVVLVSRRQADYCAICPDVPGCTTLQATRRQAEEAIEQLITAEVEQRKRSRKTLPTPATSAMVIRVPV